MACTVIKEGFDEAGEEVMFKIVALIVESEGLIVATDFVPNRVTIIIHAESITGETFAVDVAIVGNRFVGKIIFEAIAFFGGNKRSTEVSKVFERESVVLEEVASFGRFSDDVKHGDIELTGRGDITIIELGGKHGSKGGVFLFEA